MIAVTIAIAAFATAHVPANALNRHVELTQRQGYETDCPDPYKPCKCGRTSCLPQRP